MNTTDPLDPGLQEKLPNGQQAKHLVLPKADRAKGFMRPVCGEYEHEFCGKTTVIGNEIAETFARQPDFYDSTFCSHCREYDVVSHFHWCDDLGGVLGSIPAAKEPALPIGGEAEEPESFTPPPVKGYRELSKADVDMMNDIKQLGEEIQKRVDALMADPETDKRWVSIGATELQQGCMALTRSIARPSTFA
jgi:hypothetical protein